MSKRANYLPVSSFHDLNWACRVLEGSFSHGVYLVGSCLTRPDYRDVDVRCILSDEEFAAMFPEDAKGEAASERWLYLCSVISARLSRDSALPIDFQFQQMTTANQKYNGPRCALGIGINRPSEAASLIK